MRIWYPSKPLPLFPSFCNNISASVSLRDSYNETMAMRSSNETKRERRFRQRSIRSASWINGLTYNIARSCATKQKWCLKRETGIIITFESGSLGRTYGVTVKWNVIEWEMHWKLVLRRQVHELSWTISPWLRPNLSPLTEKTCLRN